MAAPKFWMCASALFWLCASALAEEVTDQGKKVTTPKPFAQLFKTGGDVGKVPGDVSWSWMGTLSQNKSVTSGSEFELSWAKTSGAVGYHSWKLIAWSDEIDLFSEGVPYWAGTAEPADVYDLWHNGVVVGKAGSQQGSVKQTVTCPKEKKADGGCKVMYQIVLLGVMDPDSQGIGTVDESEYNVSPVLEVTITTSGATVPTTTITKSSGETVPTTTITKSSGETVPTTTITKSSSSPTTAATTAPSATAPPAPRLKYVENSWREFLPGESVELGAEKWHGAPYPETWKILMEMWPAAGKNTRRSLRGLEASSEEAKEEAKEVKEVLFLEDAVVVPVDPSQLVCRGTFPESERILGHMLASCKVELPAEEGIFYYKALFCIDHETVCSESAISNLVVSLP